MREVRMRIIRGNSYSALCNGSSFPCIVQYFQRYPPTSFCIVRRDWLLLTMSSGLRNVQGARREGETQLPRDPSEGSKNPIRSPRTAHHSLSQALINIIFAFFHSSSTSLFSQNYLTYPPNKLKYLTTYLLPVLLNMFVIQCSRM